MTSRNNSIKGRQTWATPMDNKPWDAADMKRLRADARRGASARQAAKNLGRTVGSVKYKAMVEEVHFKFVRQPSGVQRRPSVRRKLRKARLARGLAA